MSTRTEEPAMLAKRATSRALSGVVRALDKPNPKTLDALHAKIQPRHVLANSASRSGVKTANKRSSEPARLGKSIFVSGGSMRVRVETLPKHKYIGRFICACHDMCPRIADKSSGEIGAQTIRRWPTPAKTRDSFVFDGAKHAPSHKLTPMQGMPSALQAAVTSFCPTRAPLLPW